MARLFSKIKVCDILIVILTVREAKQKKKKLLKSNLEFDFQIMLIFILLKINFKMPLGIYMKMNFIIQAVSFNKRWHNLPIHT